jgi:hypothetical protein
MMVSPSQQVASRTNATVTLAMARGATSFELPVPGYQQRRPTATGPILLS